MLQFCEKVNPGSDVNRNANIGVNAIGKNQEKNALLREEAFPFKIAQKNDAKKSKNSARTKLCSGSQKKNLSDLSQ